MSELIWVTILTLPVEETALVGSDPNVQKVEELRRTF